MQLQLENRTRERALFDLAIDSKLRACDLVSLRVADITLGGTLARRACVQQRKTGRPVQFEFTPQTRQTVSAWIAEVGLAPSQFLFPSRCANCTHLSTRQYGRLVKSWVAMIGLDPYCYGTHSLRRTKASLIYRQTKNLRAVQLLLGHTKLESDERFVASNQLKMIIVNAINV